MCVLVSSSIVFNIMARAYLASSSKGMVYNDGGGGHDMAAGRLGSRKLRDHIFVEHRKQKEREVGSRVGDKPQILPTVTVIPPARLHPLKAHTAPSVRDRAFKYMISWGAFFIQIVPIYLYICCVMYPRTYYLKHTSFFLLTIWSLAWFLSWAAILLFLSGVYHLVP